MVSVSFVLAAVAGALLVLGAAHAGGGCRGQASTAGAGQTVTMTESCFVPTVLHAKAGEPIIWRNESEASHSVAGATLEWGDYSERGPGQTVSHAFALPGAYPYYCFVHNGMIGTVVVSEAGDAPPAAFAAATFALDGGGDGVHVAWVAAAAAMALVVGAGAMAVVLRGPPE